MEKRIVRVGFRKHVLEAPTIDGSGKLALTLKKLTALTYKEVITQKRKPNQETVGKAVTNVYLLITADGKDYSVQCEDLQEADALYCNIIKFM